MADEFIEVAFYCWCGRKWTLSVYRGTSIHCPCGRLVLDGTAHRAELKARSTFDHDFLKACGIKE